MGQDQGFETVRNLSKPHFLFSILQKMFHQNKQFDIGLVVLWQKMKELLKFEISKMDPVHPVVNRVGMDANIGRRLTSLFHEKKLANLDFAKESM